MSGAARSFPRYLLRYKAAEEKLPKRWFDGDRQIVPVRDAIVRAISVASTLSYVPPGLSEKRDKAHPNAKPSTWF